MLTTHVINYGLAVMAISALLLYVEVVLLIFNEKAAKKYSRIRSIPLTALVISGCITALFWDLWFGIAVNICTLALVFSAFAYLKKSTVAWQTLSIFLFCGYFLYLAILSDIWPSESILRALLGCSGIVLAFYALSYSAAEKTSPRIASLNQALMLLGFALFFACFSPHLLWSLFALVAIGLASFNALLLITATMDLKKKKVKKKELWNRGAVVLSCSLIFVGLIFSKSTEFLFNFDMLNKVA